MYVTHLPHFLNDQGDLPPGLPGPAQRLAAFFCEIVRAVTTEDPDEEDVIMPVCCRRRPGHVPCKQPLLGGYDLDDPRMIYWHCPRCGDDGVITGWEHTRWDARPLLAVVEE
jgi:hypothetical protein